MRERRHRAYNLVMRDTPLIVFGAGATKDCGGFLTNEILHGAFASDVTLSLQQNALNLLQQFLNANFPVP
jgi:hypothetical protein